MCRRGTEAAGHRFAVAAAGAHVWDTRTGRQVAALDAPGVKTAVLSADGAFLAAVGTKEITVWRPAAPEAPVFRHALEDRSFYGSLAWEPCHSTLRHLEGDTVHSLDTAPATTTEWAGQATTTAEACATPVPET
ncbi:hypothetical protein [Streptomyces sp. NPDC091217]|uniref:hypothetical protein n=1 Tax=Streptomyces sp. NPDC091217 TaxID=3365975 RepID=UPI0037F22D96